MIKRLPGLWIAMFLPLQIVNVMCALRLNSKAQIVKKKDR